MTSSSQTSHGYSSMPALPDISNTQSILSTWTFSERVPSSYCHELPKVQDYGRLHDRKNTRELCVAAAKAFTALLLHMTDRRRSRKGGTSKVEACKEPDPVVADRRRSTACFRSAVMHEGASRCYWLPMLTRLPEFLLVPYIQCHLCLLSNSSSYQPSRSL